MNALDDPRAKIAHAWELYGALDEAVQRFLDAHPYRVTVDIDGKTNRKFWRLHCSFPEPPLRISSICGSILYDLRSGLDHVVCCLVRANDPTATCEGTEFPIFIRSPKKGFGQRIDGVGPKARAIIDTLQPYGGNELDRFWMEVLYTLSNIDKHRHLHVTTVQAAGLLMDLASLTSVPDFKIHTGPVYEGVILADAPNTVNIEFRPSIEVGFINPEWAFVVTRGGVRVLFNNLIGNIQSVIERFHVCFPEDK